MKQIHSRFFHYLHVPTSKNDKTINKLAKNLLKKVGKKLITNTLPISILPNY